MKYLRIHSCVGRIAASVVFCALCVLTVESQSFAAARHEGTHRMSPSLDPTMTLPPDAAPSFKEVAAYGGTFDQPWHFQNPYPDGNILYSVDVMPNGNIVASGFLGTILLSTDQGGTWSSTHEAGGVTYPMGAIQMVDNSIGYAVSSSGVAVKTTDGGLNWTSQAVNGMFGLYGLKFVDDNNGYAVGGLGTIYSTTDGGTTWTQSFLGPNITLNCVDFVDVNYGYVAGDSGKIYHTTNAGASWTLQNTDSIGVAAIKFSTYLHGVAVGESGKTWHTFDGGATWVSPLLPLTIGSLNGISMIDSLHGFLVGSGGFVAATTNGGGSWAQTGNTVKVTLSGVKFADANTGYAVGMWGAISKTTDGGSTWNLLSHGSHNLALTSISMSGSGFGVATADNGTVLMTGDFGSDWNPTGTTSGRPLSVFTFDAAHTWVCRNDGAILFSSDSAETFSAESSKVVSPLNQIMFVDPNNGFAVGDFGKVTATTNGGSTWMRMPFKNSGETLGGLFFFDALNGFVVGTLGRISQTNDGGMTWTTVQADSVHYLRSIYFADALNGWAVGFGGVIFNSGDGGNTWTQQASPVTNNLQRVVFTDDNVGWAVGDDGVIVYTTDGGSVWSQVYTACGRNLTGLAVLDSSNAWVSGQMSSILKYGAGAFAAQPKTVKKKLKPQVGLNNYPNPFNPATNITFTLPQASILTIRVYNILGQEVATLARNSAFTEGRHQITFAPATSPSGLYFCRLTSADGRFREIVKMLLIR